MPMNPLTDSYTKGRMPARAAEVMAAKGTKSGTLTTSQNGMGNAPIVPQSFTASPGKPVDGLGKMMANSTTSADAHSRMPAMAPSMRMRK